MNTDHLTDSFVKILSCVSETNKRVAPDTPLKRILSGQDYDSLDFELAVTCFEVTHHVSLDYRDLTEEEFGELSIRRLIEEHLDTTGQESTDPLFVTKRFLIFKQALIQAIETYYEDE